MSIILKKVSSTDLRSYKIKRLHPSDPGSMSLTLAVEPLMVLIDPLVSSGSSH